MTETAAADQREAPAGVSKARANAVFVAVMLGMLLAALDQTIVSTALPTIVGDLGGAGHLSWVVTAYLLAETISTALVGKFGDLFGRKQMFLTSVLIFTIGSFFCGFANSMTWLILWRGVQGLGGGGLMVTASALIADVIPLRDRGKYQGALGSVFGVVTVIGPLLGGLFVDHLSWRWAFYVNIPVAVIVLAVAVPAIPAVRSAVRPVIDYLGILLIALGASGLTLVTSWGGTTYPWGSPTIIWLAVGSVVALTLFVFVELRAVEPVLPMLLFRNPVFTVAGLMSFIVGFAMLGGITYLPTYMQYVQGTSATVSGLRMLPMVFGILLASIFSGTAVSRTGRYRIYPMLGAAAMTVGFYLLSMLDETTGLLLSSLYMFVLGVGVGLGMQVLVIAVQNTCDYADLGVATSGVTFLRTLGSSFGVAVFGTVYANKLTTNLAEALAANPLPPGVDPRVAQSPQALHTLPGALSAPLVHAYAETLHVVFLAVIPVALIALVLSFFLKEVPLRDTARAAASDMGDGFAMPASPDSDQELEQAIGALMRRERATVTTEVLTRSSSELDEAAAWCVVRVHLSRDRRGGAELTDIAEQVQVPAAVLAPAFTQAVDAGYLTGGDGRVELTPTGEREFHKLAEAWQGWLTEKLSDWRPGEQAELTEALRRVAGRLVGDQAGDRVPAHSR
ncbi:MFS transporter [Solihabitans fulvus]|uniref:MFS transporter n=1 Tax=Solihabitans fulvus TaxID=1892852 RepID=A0A5B2XCC2_9PSEU|nr:MFS transporter [Solihabitans fulvus]KAA2261257.1 MFS transporter [Solihabitans fulvus]